LEKFNKMTILRDVAFFKALFDGTRTDTSVVLKYDDVKVVFDDSKARTDTSVVLKSNIF